MSAAATSGHCGETQYESRSQTCELATSGAWSLKASGIADLAECAAWCREHCRRCRFVSYNEATDDCSWYEECSSRHAQPLGYRTLAVNQSDGIRSHQRRPRVSLRLQSRLKECEVTPSFQAGTSAPAVAVGPTRRLKVGIATLFVPNAQAACRYGIGCGVLPWCVAARRLMAVLAASTNFSVDLLAVHGPPPSNASVANVKEAHTTCHLTAATEQLDRRDCPELRLLSPSVELQAAAHAHAQRVIRGGIMSYNARYIERGQSFLYKWELLRLSEYDAVLHADLDIDLMPYYAHPPTIAREWASKLPALLARARHGPSAAADASPRRLHIVGYHDSSTVFNGGMFWLFPPKSERLYWDGIDVLRAPWNATHGWERAGTPAELFAERPATFGDDGSLNAGVKIDVASWSDIDCGDLDQGFLLYMLQFRHRVGAYVRGSQHQPIHYVGHSHKPWVRALSYRSFNDSEAACTHTNLVRDFYLRGFGKGSTASSSACGDAFRQAARELARHLDRQQCCARRGEDAPHGPPGHVRVNVF